ncbi:MAG TPA: YidB family protein [Gammaproteobacteria bacterium]|jgi:uncharacterized protein YidB (DUF937 family)|nr:YidB family protein [Gammaproteobacteria bacterium]
MGPIENATSLFIGKVGASGAGLSDSAVNNALGALLGDAHGDIDLGSIISKLDGGGLAALAETWLGDGANDRVSALQIVSLFGEPHLDSFASRLGLGRSAAAEGLAGMLPDLIDRASRGGRLLEGSEYGIRLRR